MDEIVINKDFSAVINEQTELVIPSDAYVRLERFSVLNFEPELVGQRVSVMAKVLSPTVDGRTIEMNVAVSSFIIGKDFDHNSDIIISPVDKATLSIIGAPVDIQVLYTKFPK